MKIIQSLKSNFLFIILMLVLASFTTSCSDDSTDESSSDSGWVSHLGLEGNYRAELSITNSNEYFMVGLDHILKIDVNGNVIQEMTNIFSTPPEGRFNTQRIYDDKVYQFTSIGYSNSNAVEKIDLEIYDNNGNLLESTELDATYTLIDVIIEDDKMTLLTWDWNDPSITGARTNIFQVNHDGELLLKNNLTSFPGVTGRLFDIELLEDGNFMFEFANTLYKVNDQFELITSVDLNKRIHEFTEGPDGNIYVGGSILSDSLNFIMELDNDLNTIKETRFNNLLTTPILSDLDPYAIGSLAIHNNTIYSMEVAYEYGQELRIQCFDLDLNKTSEFILEGSAPRSDLKINELGSVSFLYGNPYAPYDDYPDPSIATEARLFKIDTDCQLPEEKIFN